VNRPLPEVDDGTLRSTLSTLGACTTSDVVLRPPIGFRGDGDPRFDATDRRARRRGELAETSASVGVELVIQVRGHVARSWAFTVRLRSGDGGNDKSRRR
jgi:hypothetical protein